MEGNSNEKVFFTVFDNQDMHRWFIDVDDVDGEEVEYAVFMHCSITHSVIPWFKGELEGWMQSTDKPLLVELQEGDGKKILQDFLNENGARSWIEKMYEQLVHHLPPDLKQACEDKEQFKIQFITKFTIDVFKNMIGMLETFHHLQEALGKNIVPDDSFDAAADQATKTELLN